MVLVDAADEAIELQAGDVGQHLGAERIARNNDQPGRAELPGTAPRSARHFGVGQKLGIVATCSRSARARVRREQDDGVLELMWRPSPSSIHPLSNTWKNSSCTSVGLFDFVEQDDAIRPAADRLGQHTALAITRSRAGRPSASRPGGLPGTRSC